VPRALGLSLDDARVAVVRCGLVAVGPDQDGLPVTLAGWPLTRRGRWLAVAAVEGVIVIHMVIAPMHLREKRYAGVRLARSTRPRLGQPAAAAVPRP
jgi:hypothetical protein